MVKYRLIDKNLRGYKYYKFTVASVENTILKSSVLVTRQIIQGNFELGNNL